MAKLTLISPLGEYLENPDLSTLKELVLTGREEYWNVGSGQACVDWADRYGTRQLIITYSAGLGFYLVYVDPARSRFVSLGEGDFEHTVQPYVCGEPILLPTKFFVSREQAWEAIEEFCVNGNRTSGVRWALSAETGWNYGME